MSKSKSQMFLNTILEDDLLSDDQWSKNMLNPSHNILLLKCVLVCAWFVHRRGPEREKECVRDKSWEKQTDCGGFDVRSELGPQTRY